MSAPVAYLRRGARGARLEGVRLVGAALDASWSAPARSPDNERGDDASVVNDSARLAAAWVRDQLRAARLPARLAAVCLDADGALASWVRAPSRDPAAIAAAVQQPGAMSDDATDDELPASELSLSADAESAARASVTPLVPRGHEGLSRVGALATPDLAARLVLDRLDECGVAADHVVSVWHALADAWDPRARDTGAQRAERIVASAAAGTSAILAPDDGGRLLWAWSRAGELLAAGSCRARTVGHNGEARVQLDRATLARVAADWVAWGPQLGASPTRVVALLPQGAWTDAGASLAASLTGAWPDATVDVIEEPAPIDAALERLAQREGGAGIPALTARPGRLHRAMHRWTGLALLAVAGAMLVAAWRVREATAGMRATAADTRAEWRALASTLDERALEPGSGDPLLFLSDELAAQRATFRPVEAIRPVMRELEALSFVLADASSLTLSSVAIDSTSARVELRVPDIETYEAVLDALKNIGGSALAPQWQGSAATSGTEIRGTYFATWPEGNVP